MDLLLNYGVYLSAGLLISLISTYNVKNIAKGNAFRASASSFVSILVSTLVVVDIVSSFAEDGAVSIVLYALGFATGNYIIVKKNKA